MIRSIFVVHIVLMLCLSLVTDLLKSLSSPFLAHLSPKISWSSHSYLRYSAHQRIFCQHKYSSSKSSFICCQQWNRNKSPKYCCILNIQAKKRHELLFVIVFDWQFQLIFVLQKFFCLDHQNGKTNLKEKINLIPQKKCTNEMTQTISGKRIKCTISQFSQFTCQKKTSSSLWKCSFEGLVDWMSEKIVKLLM